ncbi:MAG: outer membrane lipoprotein-sorting protein [Flavobacteriaceae bacterium]
MKKIKVLIMVLVAGFTVQLNAQTVDEILSTYFENIGGLENLQKLEGVKMTAKVNQQGMEIPLEIIQLKGGEQMTVITFQGKKIKQGVFDGTTLWSTNFMTMKAEKSPKEVTDNMKLEMNDFPDPFIDYKKKGYKVELLGKETIDGTEMFKIKLTKEPVTVDGKKEDNVSFYFFDTENFVPLVVQAEIKSGPAKGKISETKFSDYQEVEGIYFPFSISQGLKGQPGQGVTIDTLIVNPKVDMTAFKFPEDTSKKTEDKK